MEPRISRGEPGVCGVLRMAPVWGGRVRWEERKGEGCKRGNGKGRGGEGKGVCGGMGETNRQTSKIQILYRVLGLRDGS